MPYPRLFSPVKVGSKTARNRVMRLATLTNTIQGGQVTDATLALYRRIARGGSGIVVTEGMRIHPSSTGHGHSMQLYVPGTIDSVRRLSRTKPSMTSSTSAGVIACGMPPLRGHGIADGAHSVGNPVP